MSELLVSDAEHTRNDYPELLAEISSQAVNPPGRDESIGQMWHAYMEYARDESQLKDFANDFAVHREGSVSEKAGTLRTIFTNDVLVYKDGLPEGEEAWRQYFDELESALDNFVQGSDKQADRIDDLLGNAVNLTRRVQTNIFTRYTSTIELIMQIYHERFEGGVRWLDNGCGINEGQNALLMKQELHLPPVRIRTPDNRADPSLTQKVNELRARPSLIDEATGVDLFDPSEQKARDWVRASLRHVTELKNPSFMAQFDLLAEARPNNVSTAKLDITDDEAVAEFRRDNPDLKPNFESFITMLHQLPPADRQKAFHNAVSLAADDALIVIQDFSFAPVGNSSKLSYYKHWHETPYRYRTFVYDKLHPELGMQEAFKSYDSRCEELRLGIGQLATRSNRLVSVEEALETA